VSDRPEDAPAPAAAESDAARQEGSAPSAAEPDAFARLEGLVEPDVWEMLVRWRGAGRRVALLTVAETRGMTPRKAGARMLYSEDGETCGTVGGGVLEQTALEAAREALAGQETERTLRWQLTQELGMCCGGEMTLRIEIVEPAPRLVVFGAGYIGRSLAQLAVGCGFRVTVVDDRPEWADPAQLKGMNVECRDADEFVRGTPPGPRDYAVVVTHDHALDQRLVERMLQRPPLFLGLVGSLAKQRKFAMRLRAKGYDEVAVARLKSPLGLAIGAATPEEIAVSVMAELVAARRGVDVGPTGAPPRRHEGSRRTPRAGTDAAASLEVESP
jgi:xanthine dehydrogenase accessory factor